MEHGAVTTFNIKPRPYRLRLLERVAFYDDVKTNRFWDWPKGTIISDQTQIELIEARGGLVERIETFENGDSK
jgi:hypothetical protein